MPSHLGVHRPRNYTVAMAGTLDIGRVSFFVAADVMDGLASTTNIVGCMFKT